MAYHIIFSSLLVEPTWQAHKQWGRCWN